MITPALDKPEAILAFAGLQTSLERVDSALKDLLKGWGYQSL
jgi:hypothetical protein